MNQFRLLFLLSWNMLAFCGPGRAHNIQSANLFPLNRHFVTLGGVEAMVFSPEGDSLVCVVTGSKRKSRQVAIECVNLKTGKVHRRFIPQPLPLLATTLSSEAATLVTSDGKLVRFWDTGTGRLKYQLRTGAKVLALSPDGTVLAAASGLDPEIQSTIRLWDIQTGKWLYTLSSKDVETWNDLEVKSVNFSRSGNLLISANGNYTVSIWNIRTGRLVKSVSAGTEAVISSDNRYLAIRNPSPIGPSDDPKTAVYCDGLELYDASTMTLKSSLTLSCTPANDDELEWMVSMAFSPDGKTLCAGVLGSHGKEGIRFYEVKSGKLIKTIEEPRGVPTLLCFSPDGKNLASAAGKTVTIRFVC